MELPSAHATADQLRSLPIERQEPAAQLGVRVVKQLVELIVTGRVPVGGLLPTELALCDQFGVSRTVIRESVKRLQEKGMIGVTRGRGMYVEPMKSWNMLDPIVLAAFIDYDDFLGTFDELSRVRGALEALMAGMAASIRSEDDLAMLRERLERMRNTLHKDHEFRDADVEFHFTVMEISKNHLAENITRRLFSQARFNTRFDGVTHDGDLSATLAEHERVFTAIENRDSGAASDAMRTHIEVAWSRRRLPSPLA